MPTNQFSVDEIFAEALRRPQGSERANYLDEIYGQDAAARERMERLLRAHAEAHSFLEAPAADPLATTEHESLIDERAGTIIGPYKLLQQIGEGGMGIVFMAAQSVPIQRTVALKIIKPGMDTRQVIARFAAERQALALMDHPNIAKVVDAGTTETGRPYFVMELVKGVPITKYCDDKRLPLRERLNLFLPVCQAVQHAHLKGVIHRDIKPSNVLVPEYDDHASPKIIDFGIAKATAQKLTERTMFTEFGQVIGTVEYMSPEQAKFNQLDIDTRSDIYSLGVLLYELLTGSPPFERQRLREAAFDEVLRIIREEEPHKPSTRLSTAADPQVAPDKRSSSRATAAANRHTEPDRLSKELRGELDWIVMRSLEKDRQRRYQTANSLANDIERYLADQPIEACPPSATYRFKKLIRRNKTAFAAGIAIASAVCLGAAIAGWQAIRATRAESQALEHLQAETQARKDAEAVTEFLVTAFESPDPAKDGRSVTVAEVLNRAEKRLEDDLHDQGLTRAALLFAIGSSRSALGVPDEAVKPLTEAARIREERLGLTHPDTLNAKIKLGYAYLQHLAIRPEWLDPAKAMFDQVYEVARNEFGDENPLTLSAMHGLANCTSDRQIDEAIALYEKTYEARQRVLGPEHPDTLSSATQLAIRYTRANRWQDARPILERVVAIEQKTFGPGHPHALYALNALANTYSAEGQYAQAVRLHEKCLVLKRKTFGDDHRETKKSVFNIVHQVAAGANALRDTGKSEEAEQFIRRIVQRYVQTGQYALAYMIMRSASIDQFNEFVEAAPNLNLRSDSGGLDALVLGELQILAGKPQNATRAILASIVRGAQQEQAYKSLGWALLAQGHDTEAHEAFRNALALRRVEDGTFDLDGVNPDELTAAYFLDLINENDYANRLKDYKNSACLAWFYIAQRREIEGLSDAAIAAYKRCVELAPPDSGQLALANWRIKKIGSAAE